MDDLSLYLDHIQCEDISDDCRELVHRIYDMVDDKIIDMGDEE